MLWRPFVAIYIYYLAIYGFTICCLLIYYLAIYYFRAWHAIIIPRF